MANLLLRIAVAAAALLTGVGATLAQEVSLRLHHFLPAGAPTQQSFLAPWTQRVLAASGGRLRIDIYPAMQLGGTAPQLVDQVRDGVVDMVWTLPSYTPGRFPKTEAFELPFVMSDPITMNRALQDFYRTQLRDEYAGIHVLLLHVHMGQVFHMREGQAIRSMEDLRGKTLRTPGATGTLFLEAAGAIPYHAPVPEMPQLLSRGVVDGVMVPFEVVPPYKVHELTKHHTFTEPRIHTAVFMLAMNPASYANLPDDLKKVIDDTTGQTLAEIAGQVWIDVEGPGENFARERGNEFIYLPEAEVEKFRGVGQVAIDRWIADMNGRGIDGARLVADAKALIAKYEN